jgi:hypothetical protein
MAFPNNFVSMGETGWIGNTKKLKNMQDGIYFISKDLGNTYLQLLILANGTAGIRKLQP